MAELWTTDDLFPLWSELKDAVDAGFNRDFPIACGCLPNRKNAVAKELNQLRWVALKSIMYHPLEGRHETTSVGRLDVCLLTKGTEAPHIDDRREDFTRHTILDVTVQLFLDIVAVEDVVFELVEDEFVVVRAVEVKACWEKINNLGKIFQFRVTVVSGLGQG